MVGWGFLFFPLTVLELRLDESDGRAPVTENICLNFELNLYRHIDMFMRQALCNESISNIGYTSFE